MNFHLSEAKFIITRSVANEPECRIGSLLRLTSVLAARECGSEGFKGEHAGVEI
jgi:hypothetical protein